MPALRRNLLPILVGVAAVVVTIVSCGLVADRSGDRDDRWSMGRERDGRGRDEADRGPRAFPRDAERSFRAAGGAVLGVTVQSRDGGLDVQSVLPNSPAERAGVQPGDTIVRVAGRAVRDPQALRAAVASAPGGETYELVVRREGRERALRVERASQQGAAPFMQPGTMPMQPGPRMQPGFQPDGGFYIPPGMMPQWMMPGGMTLPGMMPGPMPQGVPQTMPQTMPMYPQGMFPGLMPPGMMPGPVPQGGAPAPAATPPPPAPSPPPTP